MVLDCHFAYLHFIIKCEVLEVFVWIYGYDSSGALKKVANKEYYTFYTSQVGLNTTYQSMCNVLINSHVSRLSTWVGESIPGPWFEGLSLCKTRYPKLLLMAS